MSRRTAVLIVLGIILLLIVGIGIGRLSAQKTSMPLPTSQPEVLTNSNAGTTQPSSTGTVERATIKRIIDGDTVELGDGRKLRYIGIDTPETVDPRVSVECFGREASAYNRSLVEGKEVELEKDISDTDRYGRLLRYVYLLQEGKRVMVNKLLVSEGYAVSSSYPPDIKYQKELDLLEVEAQSQNKGLWNSCTINSVSPQASIVGSASTTTAVNGTITTTNIETCTIKGNISSSGEKIYHLPGCGSYDKTAINEQTGERWFCSEDEAVSTGWRKAKNC
ncbi:TPA: nuclease [Patescibacteria group bacterium]|uniref:Prophage LambdaCh01 nuclease domain-containing protein n=1 Tax=Candidatus Gottesmanbacteria bacterium GW2011_GWA1_43_11 TaxID=1618436 RepID=A0A0G1CIE2_9BACT|nr:MAG: prophage LambdaCh01 nuclease domain-containing protein [Candidatus Gottesmanbacteria bacterium GW2011_GWA1_43_11]HCS79242.1 nuclease [Patescibacteria group bacterium]